MNHVNIYFLSLANNTQASLNMKDYTSAGCAGEAAA